VPNNMKIYHNNRCSKSRQCLSLLSNAEVEVIDYIKNPLSFDELKVLVSKIGIQPAELIRTNEAIWKQNFKGKKMSDDDYIMAMIENPKLMERPIVETEEKALVCRPPELVLGLI
jgi:arsenate reductase